jgi:3-oxoadipate enol-lactonase
MATQFIERVAVEEHGQGEPVVFIHGLGGSSNTWSAMLAPHGPFARYRTIRVDLPGSGRSGRVEGTLSLERYVASVRKIIHVLNLPKVHVVAHSMGTIVAQHLAAQDPAMVRSLALFGPLFCPPEVAKASLRARANKARMEGTTGMAEIADALAQASTSAHTKRSATVALAFVRESIMRQSSSLYAASCEALANMVAVEASKIVCPTLLVTGDEDVVAPPQAVRIMQEKIVGSTAHVLRGCGHWTPIEQADECSRLLQSFYTQRM